MNKDILVPNVDVELLRKQYHYLLTSYGAQQADRDMNEGLLNLLETMLETAEGDNYANIPTV